ncbi:threonine/serine dehydratase [Planococcus sp. APC 3906]|uniref:threonine/serine dehydratase n=1 Tax=Planococcus sp. APC 3906 TaxID=3035194 RepID=UPI0025B4E2FD|nr:threonine/serine dehydratase [Planococcus sp. APC 3906]MDN3448956.1 threonine/serine dehydratase [Planococcus sp. APC 3906]
MAGLESVKRAQLNVADMIHRTPILSSEQFDLASGNRVYFKAEHLQKTGSFKIRGAANAVKNAVQAGAASVAAASSGNHGQAVAYVAKQLGVPAVIVVPETASRVKVAAIESYGAEVVYCGTTSAHRIPKAQQLAAENNGVYIPPYDHEDIISGQGTIGLELLEQVEGLDAILVPVGGGGLISGVLAAVKNVNPGIKVIGVEPEEANDTWLSLQSGRITSIPESFTIADGLRTSQPGAMTFPILQQYLDGLLLVSEADIKKTFQFLAERTKQLVEPSSAMAAAPLLFGELKGANLKAAVVLSGGNVDLKELQAFLPK